VAQAVLLHLRVDTLSILSLRVQHTMLNLTLQQVPLSIIMAHLGLQYN